MLETFQTKKDEFSPHSSEDPSEIHVTEETNPEPDFEREAAQEEAEMQFLDQLFAGHNPDNIIEEDESDLIDTEADVRDMDVGTAGFTDYMNV